MTCLSQATIVLNLSGKKEMNELPTNKCRRFLLPIKNPEKVALIDEAKESRHLTWHFFIASQLERSGLVFGAQYDLNFSICLDDRFFTFAICTPRSKF